VGQARRLQISFEVQVFRHNLIVNSLSRRFVARPSVIVVLAYAVVRDADDDIPWSGHVTRRLPYAAPQQNGRHHPQEHFL